MEENQQQTAKINESFELKLLKVLLPLLIYLGVSMLVQIIFSLFALKQKFMSIEDSDTNHYQLAYHFFDNTSEYIQNYILVAMFISAIITIGILLLMLRREKNSAIIMREMDIRQFLLIVGMGIFVSGGLGKLLYLLKLDGILGSNGSVNETFLENPLLFQILTLCFAVPIVEELVFRGLIYSKIEYYADKMYGVILTAILFGIYHGNLLQGIYAGILSILLCFVYEKCQSFFAPILLHMTANTTALLTMYFPVSKFIENHLLIKIIVMIAELAALCFCVYEMWKKEK